MHKTITNYIESSNARDVEGQVSCFTSDAIVEDEGKTRRGTDEIRAWIEESQDAYNAILQVEDVEGDTVTCLVSGNFDGSPISLKFEFALVQDRIAKLSISG